jgi:hypothetical protein
MIPGMRMRMGCLVMLGGYYSRVAFLLGSRYGSACSGDGIGRVRERDTEREEE